MISSPISTCTEVVEMISKLPKEVFEKSTRSATKKLIASISLVTIGAYLVYALPWYLLPIGWIFMGTACCGLFAVGYACGNDLFFKNKFVNYVVGTICMLPLMYPLDYWKKRIEKKASEGRDFVREIASGHYWYFSSLLQWLSLNFSFKFSKGMMLSVSFLYLFIALFFPLMTYGFGVWGLFKYYLIPLFVYHFWMSTFLKASSLSNFSSKPTFFALPSWVEYLTQDFNIGVTLTNMSQNIGVPSYKWKDAYKALKKEYESITELSFATLLTQLPPVVQHVGEKSTPTVELNKEENSGEVLYAVHPSRPWYEKVNWKIAAFLLGTPVLAIYGILTTPYVTKTYITAFIAYYIAGMGITAGYHRLFSHRSYKAKLPVRIILMLMGTSTFEGSVFEWCQDHRAHHRFTDTDKDPYNVKKGLFYSHMGWMLLKRIPGDSDISDLEADPVLRFQHKYFVPLAFSLGWFVPMFICGLGWGDWRGGFLIAGVASKVFMMQCTFCINSLAHYLGEATYTDQRSPRDSFITSLVTFGEGYHNFHHEFPYDYRNGIHHSAYDPGKWLICLLSWFGQAYELKRFPSELFVKGKIQMAEKKIREQRDKLNWGKPISELPQYTRLEFKEKCQKEKKQWLVVENVIYDMIEFASNHPGGKQLIDDYIGKDATRAFNGAVYNHSFAARNYLDMYRCAVLKNDEEKSN
ncbi:hypothetical protein DICPUDRAFT_52931 [Dictyostelium purpureum]|uniref:Cytochrome b5 heme-binding domain-containing protein n=1 Tax=Dictyostelium purpureum TaxID=5786 RepID=F0ZAI8_DICPU|nr:uncharacterized protein DICPUDRAFT_52931 [Dictyostelium purpureum]EGC39055.1 hypothetical protein DICPUDRAFT_52931 [Dictyostelium purpureum]|eukprot:XP_003284405.1 hypothetical protein DICPUDRAFT_52931 [Dictyostelium purpureum]